MAADDGTARGWAWTVPFGFRTRLHADFEQ